MPMFEWDDALSIGNPIIDEQHMHLLDLVNQSYDSVTEGASRESTTTLLYRMIDYAFHHFHCEECLMMATAYPDVADHTDAHREFTDRILELQSDFEERGTVVARNILSFLVEWFVTHVMVADAHYARFAAALSPARDSSAHRGDTPLPLTAPSPGWSEPSSDRRCPVPGGISLRGGKGG